MLTKEELEHLAVLARIELKAGEEEKLKKDLGSILEYFNELKMLQTDNVTPMTGGTALVNALREDEVNDTDDTGKGVSNFPDTQERYLKVPPVF